MSFSKRITAAVLAVAFTASYMNLIIANAGVAALPKATAVVDAPTPQDAQEQNIERRERDRNGISVDEPKVYDDALLQQMLQVAEARLASLQVIDQKLINDRQGAVSGASLQTSSLGVNVQGAPVPGVVTTSRGATGSTNQSTQTNAAGATTGSSLTTLSGLASQDVVTTQPQISPPGQTAPAPTTTLPSSGFSVSSSDILNEQIQLTAEINGLRLLLSGNLSDYFSRGGSATKLRTTLGFPITIIPDKRYKDAVAIVEVEVEKTAQATEKPAVTQLLPREKTYNVAAITDKSTSIGGGVATQILGISASFLRGNKTYYLVQDQDTVALAFKPDDANRVGFMWEFRPVLGRRYVKAGLKQTFVQLAFGAPGNARESEIGNVIVRTYWRKYDREKGIHKEIIPGSLSKQELPFNIPRFNLAVRPPSFTAENDLEELGGGQMLVKLKGRFLPGTYVRIGGTLLTEAQQRLMHDYAGIRFSAPISDLATKGVFLVAHDGTEVPLTFNMPSVCGIQDDKDGTGKIIGNTTRKFVGVGTPKITTLDETNSRVSIDFAVEKTVARTGVPNVVTQEAPAGEIPALVLTVGSRAFGFSDIQRAGNTLTAVVPTVLLVANTKLTIKVLFANKECRADVPLDTSSPPSQAERLVPLEQGAKTKYLLYGTRLSNLQVQWPSVGVRFESIGAPSNPDKLRLVVIDTDKVKIPKQLLLQRTDPGEQPFLLTVPEFDAKKPDPPKAKERVTVDSDDALIEGEGMKELEGVTFRGQAVDFEIVDDKSIRLKKLRAIGATSTAATQTFILQFKSGAKPKVNLEIVNTKVETVPR